MNPFEKAMQQADALTKQGRYREALEIYMPLHQQIQEACRRQPSSESEEVLAVIIKDEVGFLLFQLGDYVRALPLYIEVLDVYRAVLGIDDRKTLATLNNLASCYQELGENERALPLFHEGFDVCRRTLGMDDRLTLAILNNLAMCYQKEGQNAHVLPLFIECLDECRRTLGMEDRQTLRSLNNLAGWYQEEGQNALALPLFLEGLETRRRTLGLEHPDTLGSLNNLATCYMRMGANDQAMPLFEECLNGRRGILGGEHPHTLTSITNLAMCCQSIGLSERALSLFEGALESEWVPLTRMRMLPDNMRAAYRMTWKGTLPMTLSVVWTQKIDEPKTALWLYTHALRRRMLDAELHALPQDVVLMERYRELRPQIRARQQLHQTLAQLNLSDPVGARHRIRELEKQVEAIERVLIPQIPELAASAAQLSLDRKAVALSLPPDACLIDYLRYRRFDFSERKWAEERYVAFVLAAGEAGDTHFVDLGEAEEIDALIRTFRKETQTPSRGELPPTGNVKERSGDKNYETLVMLLWQPVVGAVGAAQRVYIAPDYEIAQVPFELLAADRRFVYVPSGGEIVRSHKRKWDSTRSAPLLIADPNFRLQDSPQLARPEPKHGVAALVDWIHGRFGRHRPRPDPVHVAAAAPDSSPAVTVRDALRKGEAMTLKRLPGTHLEAMRLKALTGSHPWLRNEAVSALLAQNPAPSLLVMATHGFAMEDLPLPGLGENPFAPLLKQAVETELNPMQRCGVALAGAQTYLETGQTLPGVGTGFCTAQDFTGYDLRGTRVILSACNTAQGVQRAGRGMLGLRAALLYAGARTVILTLWPVDDLATGLFMEELCRLLLLENQPVDDALIATKDWLRKLTVADLKALPFWLTGEAITTLHGLRGRSAGNVEDETAVTQMIQRIEEIQESPGANVPFADPCYWAAFVCYGDTSPFNFQR